MEKAQKELEQYEKDIGISIQEARNSLRVMRKKAIKKSSLSPVKVGLRLKDLEEMDRIARNVKRKVGRNGGGMWSFFGSDQRGSEGD